MRHQTVASGRAVGLAAEVARHWIEGDTADRILSAIIAENAARREIACDIFRGRIVDVTEKSYTIELTGDTGKLDAFLEAIDRAAILETVRTGTSGIGRGERILRL